MSDQYLSNSIKRKLLLSRILSNWPLLVWVLVAFVAVWGYQNSHKQQGYIGRVKSDTLLVSATEDTTISSLNVVPGQRINTGETIGQLDSSEIELQIAELTIEIKQDHRERERRYLEARHRLITQQQDLLVRQAEDQARLKVLAEEDKILEDVFDRGLIGRDSYISNLATVETLRSSLDLYPTLIKELEVELGQLESSKAIWDIENPNTLIESDNRISLLETRKERLRITMPRNGIVSEVYLSSGEIVTTGDPILKLVFDGKKQIIAFIPESEENPPKLGDPLYISTQSQQGNWLQAKVSELAPDIVAVPDQLSPLPGKLITGRYYYLDLLNPAELISGETVAISRRKPGTFNFLNSWRDVDTVSTVHASEEEEVR